MSSQLKYGPLEVNEFRLIRLLPPTPGSMHLEMDIIHSNLDAQHPSYTALSYTWKLAVEMEDNDSQTSHEKVKVAGEETSIHKNLAIALRCIRTGFRQYIWADALCIDQFNTPERSSQVMLMSKIFSHATHVWAWLGSQAESSHLAMDFLVTLAAKPDSQRTVEWLNTEALQPDYYPTWEALRSLMSRSWWKRAWIVQEFALAQDVSFLCGDRRISSQELEVADNLLFVNLSTAKNKLVTLMREAVAFNPRTLDPARNLLRLRQRLRRGETISLLASLQLTRFSYATDPRDHLFAKFGLSGDELPGWCHANYGSKVEDIWYAFTLTLIRTRKDLYVICLAGMQPRTYHGLPSWLPDWGPSKPRYPLCSLSGDENPQWPFFDAASGTKAIANLSSLNKTVLMCEGYQVDAVDGVVGDRWADEPTYVHQPQSRANVYRTRSGAFQALCRTVTSNTNRTDAWGSPPREFCTIFARRWQELNMEMASYELDPTRPRPFSLYRAASGFERAWRSMRDLEFAGEPLRSLVESSLGNDDESARSMSIARETNQGSETAASQPLWTALEHSAGQVCFERRLFTTVKGYLGIGPATLEPGDEVALLFGCKVPVLVRSQGLGYQLIGESYIDGIMYGEAMVGDDPRSTPKRTFDLY